MQMTSTRILLSLLSVTILAAGSAMAYEPCGTAAFQSQKVTYLPITGTLTTNGLDPRTDPDGPPYDVKLRGTLHFKYGDRETVIKNRPVLIYNHGHEQGRSEVCDLIEFFTDRKYVVFMPLRRGHYLDVDGDDQFTPEGGDIRSTGIYIDNYVELCDRTVSDAQTPTYLKHLYRESGFCRPGAPLGPEFRRGGVEMDYLNQQRIDVRDQIAYIKSLPAFSTELVPRNWMLADEGNIVILGHSYGGTLTLFANAHDYGQSVAVDVSGAELSWSNSDEPYWKYDMMPAMGDQKRPIFLLQPKNGRDLAPTKILFVIGADNLFRVQAAIYPPAPCSERILVGGVVTETFPPCSNTDTTPEFKQVHGTFISRMSQIQKWGPSVIEFARRYSR